MVDAENVTADAEKVVAAVATTAAAGQPESEPAQAERQPLSKTILLASILASSSFLNVSTHKPYISAFFCVSTNKSD